MNFLLQLRVCDPKRGSEGGLSWGWLTTLYSHISQEDHIYVASCWLTQEMLDEAGMINVHIIKTRETSFATRYIFRKIHPICYKIWQRRAYKAARKLNIKIDVIQAYSLSDFRYPGLWYRFKEAYTILGPVGGGQDCPKSLREYDDTKERVLRKIINSYCRWSPFWNFAIRRYKKLYPVNEETARFMGRKKCEQLFDVILTEQFTNLDIPEKNMRK